MVNLKPKVLTNTATRLHTHAHSASRVVLIVSRKPYAASVKSSAEAPCLLMLGAASFRFAGGSRVDVTAL